MITHDNSVLMCAGSRGQLSASNATGGGTRPARPSCCTAAGLYACSVPGAASWPAATCASGAPPKGKLASCCRSALPFRHHGWLSPVYTVLLLACNQSQSEFSDALTRMHHADVPNGHNVLNLQSQLPDPAAQNKLHCPRHFAYSKHVDIGL